MFPIQDNNFDESVAKGKIKNATMPLHFWLQTDINQGFQMRYCTFFYHKSAQNCKFLPGNGIVISTTIFAEKKIVKSLTPFKGFFSLFV